MLIGFLGLDHVVVKAEIWNEVVHWVGLCWGGGPGKEWFSGNIRLSLEELEFNLWGWNDILFGLWVNDWLPFVTKLCLSGGLVVLRD